nr:uncharacterized protein LOC129038815 [Pongo pygmaeus]
MFAPPSKRRGKLRRKGRAHLARLWDAPRSSRRSSAVLAPPMPQLSSLAVSGAPVPTRPSPTEPQAAARTPRIVDQPAPASGVPAALTIWKRKDFMPRSARASSVPGVCVVSAVSLLSLKRECLKH